jgi:hypothetical protein
VRTASYRGPNWATEESLRFEGGFRRAPQLAGGDSSQAELPAVAHSKKARKSRPAVGQLGDDTDGRWVLSRLWLSMCP